MAGVNILVLTRLAPITASVMMATDWQQTASHAFVSVSFELLVINQEVVNDYIIHLHIMLIQAELGFHSTSRVTHVVVRFLPQERFIKVFSANVAPLTLLIGYITKCSVMFFRELH